MKHYFYLGIAIIAEVIATTALKSSEGFTKIIPSIIVIIGYGVAFFFLSATMKIIPVGISYAIWSGVGVVLISIASWFVHHQSLDLPAILGMALIISGVVVINLFSKVGGH